MVLCLKTRTIICGVNKLFMILNVDFLSVVKKEQINRIYLHFYCWLDLIQ